MIKRLISWTSNLTAVALALLVLLVVYDAMMRYLFSAGSTALQELEWHLFDVVILLSIAYTMRHGAHVRVDIFYDRFSDRLKRVINILSILLFILPLSLLIIYIGYDFAYMSFLQNEASSDPGGLPYRWIVKSLIVIAFVLLTLEALRMLFEELKELKK